MMLRSMLVNYRKSEKLSLRRFARQIGIGHYVLHDFERGRPVSGQTLAQMINFLLKHNGK